MDSISENSGRTTRNGVYCPIQGSPIIFHFPERVFCTWRPNCVSTFYSGLCNQRVRRVLVYLTVSFHPLSPSIVPSFILRKFSPCLSLHLYDNSKVPIVLTASLSTRKFIKLFAEMLVGRELRTRISATDQWCKQGQPASVPAMCITPGFRTAIHHCHYKLNLLSINDFVYHHCFGWSFWPVGWVLLVFLSSFTLVEFLDHSFSLLKHF